jgi:type IV secretory pathway VirJ component
MISRFAGRTLPPIAAALGVLFVSAAWCDGSPDGVRQVAHAETTHATVDSVAVGDLPLHEVPVESPGTTMAVLLTGDGGWAAVDKAMGASLAKRGIPLVGLDSRAYLMHTRTADVMGADLRRILRHYVDSWQRPEVIVIGYSRGAELAPFMVARLPEDLRRRVRLVSLLGPGDRTSFKFHWADLVRDLPGDANILVRPEIEKLRGTPMLCIYGQQDHDAICPSLDPGLARSVARPGSHRVHPNEAEWVVATITQAWRSVRDARRDGQP